MAYFLKLLNVSSTVYDLVHTIEHLVCLQRWIISKTMAMAEGYESKYFLKLMRDEELTILQSYSKI